MKYQDYLRLLVKAGIVSMKALRRLYRERASQRLEIVDVDITERKTARGTSRNNYSFRWACTVSSDISDKKEYRKNICSVKCDG